MCRRRRRVPAIPLNRFCSRRKHDKWFRCQDRPQLDRIAKLEIESFFKERFNCFITGGLHLGTKKILLQLWSFCVQLFHL